LFIDEIHLLVGAGTAESSQMDAGNILKPALARGELQLIGATTFKEYRQIEKDAALERRLQPIIVNEPSTEEAIEILHGIKDRYLPDKAIDLMDEVGSRLNLKNAAKDSNTIEQKMQEIVKEKEKAAEREDYERAAHLRYQEIQLQKQLDKAKGKEQVTDVDVSDIQLLIEEKTGIPVTKLQDDEQKQMRDLAKNVNQKVIGQEKAV